jgi:hypothetical protein
MSLHALCCMVALLAVAALLLGGARAFSSFPGWSLIQATTPSGKFLMGSQGAQSLSGRVVSGCAGLFSGPDRANVSLHGAVCVLRPQEVSTGLLREIFNTSVPSGFLLLLPTTTAAQHAGWDEVEHLLRVPPGPRVPFLFAPESPEVLTLLDQAAKEGSAGRSIWTLLTQMSSPIVEASGNPSAVQDLSIPILSMALPTTSEGAPHWVVAATLDSASVISNFSSTMAATPAAATVQLSRWLADHNRPVSWSFVLAGGALARHVGLASWPFLPPSTQASVAIGRTSPSLAFLVSSLGTSASASRMVLRSTVPLDSSSKGGWRIVQQAAEALRKQGVVIDTVSSPVNGSVFGPIAWEHEALSRAHIPSVSIDFEELSLQLEDQTPPSDDEVDEWGIQWEGDDSHTEREHLFFNESDAAQVVSHEDSQGLSAWLQNTRGPAPPPVLPGITTPPPQGTGKFALSSVLNSHSLPAQLSHRVSLVRALLLCASFIAAGDPDQCVTAMHSPPPSNDATQSLAEALGRFPSGSLDVCQIQPLPAPSEQDPRLVASGLLPTDPSGLSTAQELLSMMEAGSVGWAGSPPPSLRGPLVQHLARELVRSCGSMPPSQCSVQVADVAVSAPKGEGPSFIPSSRTLTVRRDPTPIAGVWALLVVLAVIALVSSALDDPRALARWLVPLPTTPPEASASKIKKKKKRS